MSEIFEVLMLVCFGISWPISVVKSIKSKSTKGKSLVFTAVIILGYVCGIVSKLAAGNTTYVFWLYVLNLAVVSTDLAVSIVNKHNEAAEHKENNTQETADNAKSAKADLQPVAAKAKA